MKKKGKTYFSKYASPTPKLPCNYLDCTSELRVNIKRIVFTLDPWDREDDEADEGDAAEAETRHLETVTETSTRGLVKDTQGKDYSSYLLCILQFDHGANMLGSSYERIAFAAQRKLPRRWMVYQFSASAVFSQVENGEMKRTIFEGLRVYGCTLKKW